VHLLLRAMFASKGDLSGSGLKKGLENLPQPYRGVVSTYEQPFSNRDHDAISANMLWLGTWRSGERTYAYRDDAQRASIIRRKE
jgi:branched-chain amino acid transport system substrate-binding protein